MSVDVLDGDQVVGADVLLQASILPHHIGCGLGGHDLHCNADGTRVSREKSRVRVQGPSLGLVGPGTFSECRS